MRRFAVASLVARSFPLSRSGGAAIALLGQLCHCSPLTFASPSGTSTMTPLTPVAMSDNIDVTPTTPTPSFGSVTELVSLAAAVEALKGIEANARRSKGKLAEVTRISIAHTLRLLDEQAVAGESKRAMEERIAVGTKHALLIFALLVDGDKHVSNMDLLCKALITDPSGKAFGEVLERLCLTGKRAGAIFTMATQDYFEIAWLSELIPKDNQNLAQVLEQRNHLRQGHHFGRCSVWCPCVSHDKGFDRHIAIEPLHDATVEIIRREMDSGRAALVCGESGSGKTYSSILSAGDGVCIYLTANDFIDAATSKAVLYAELNADAVRRRNELSEAATLGKSPADQQNRRNTCLTSLLGRLISEVASSVGDMFTGRVVLVVDEVGGHPLIVKGLCREAKDMVMLLKEKLKLTGHVGVVVSGTGSEAGDDVLGSYPDTHSVISCERTAFSDHVIKLMDALGFRSLAGLLGNKPIAASYYPPAPGERSPSLAYVQRLMMNRRFAAALLVQLKSAFENNCRVPEVAPRETPHNDASVPWLTVLPWLASAALLQFKALGGLSTKSFDALCVLFADALAICFGGHEQRPCAVSRMLHRGVGMIVDNARSVLPVDAELVVPGACSGEKHVLALPKCASGAVGAHFGRRFGMGPAMLEMGLQGFSLSTAARARSGDGLEHTMVDFFHCWALACCSSVIITLPGEAPPGTSDASMHIGGANDDDAVAQRALFAIMAGIRDCVREQKVSVVLRVRLTKSTETVKDAVEQAFAMAWKMTRKEGVPFVVVAHTAPMAPFADVFVVAGVTSDSQRHHVPTMFVAVQLKNFTTTQLSPWDALSAHVKQGCPIFDTKGGKEVAGVVRRRGPSKEKDLKRLATARGLLRTASAKYKPPYPFVSLVLAVCPDEFRYTEEQCAVEQFAAMTTVRIRSRALRSVVHPIPLGSDPQPSTRSSFDDDCVKNDFRNAPPTVAAV